MSQQSAIGRHRQVQFRDARQHFHEHFDVSSQEGLSACQTDLAHSMLYKDRSQPGDLFESEQFALG
jgi:hypothetical protein